MTPLRVCFIGDSITAGTGDRTCLGWPGRACAEAIAQGRDVTGYNLGVRGDTSEQVRTRWLAEAQARLPEGLPARLVFAFGLNDTIVLGDGSSKVERGRTLDNARAVLEAARRWLPTLFIGPAPVDDGRPPPPSPLGIPYRFDNAAIGDMSLALARVMAELEIPYLDLFTPLQADAGWRECMQAGDAVHPPAEGYAMIAARVSAWTHWQALISD